MLSSPAVSRITGAQLFAEISPKILGPSLMPQKAGRETCCYQAQVSCPGANAEQLLQKIRVTVPGLYCQRCVLIRYL